MIDFLTRANISGFDASAYISRIANNASALPNIGLAMSGGGYRALMNGAGFIAAADNRTQNSTGPGQIGGLLQASTYLAGLSGGSWLVGSMFTNNFSSVEQLRDNPSVWQFGNGLLQGPSTGLFSTAEYLSNIEKQVQRKRDAGFSISITDYWGRALSYQLVNVTEGGPAYTFSSIALEPNFSQGDTPFPVLVSDGRAPGTKVVSLNSTVFEFNPFELGTWDPTTYAFAPLRYIGSNFSGGVIPAGQQCVRGFDNAGFVMGTSSSLFNLAITQLNQSSLPSFIQSALSNILNDIGAKDDDIAEYSPNPFYGYKGVASRIVNSTQLSLVDGGEDLQNVPLYPLIQPMRGVDVIFAVDSSADTTYSWPNGTALVATYERSLNNSIENGTSFPAIPDQNTFVNLGLNTRPTFFGCNASNTTGPAPLVVYIPNAPYITLSNVSTFDPTYNNTQRNMIIRNGYDVATLGNGTMDSEWPTCVACAVLSRSFHKTGTALPAACVSCFDRYCWNGTLSSANPSQNYTPAFKLGEVSLASSDATSQTAGFGFTFVALIVGAYLAI